MAVVLRKKSILNFYLFFIIMAGVTHASECPATDAALISNAGNERFFGSLSQSFIIPPGYETISGRLKFLSNEWPRWYGSEFNDTYLARFSAPGKVSILASGNVNSSEWVESSLGYNGETPEINYNLDVSGAVGKVATLYYEVRDVGDSSIASALAIDGVKVIRTHQYVSGEGGAFSRPGIISGLYGQAVKITFKNVNVVGTTISVKDNSPFGETKQLILAPQQEATFLFTRGGSEPMNWSFNVSTLSDAFLVDYKVESTWVDGMPNNPCY